ncbi:cbb3-type cytochrome c oxidase subunit II [Occallatibacter riparius]|uniref:Cbb3-type cytochrome c oxidase subunit II n=1 Tax=Occallatibacter riparius TaxID=1002689 RepID=A0A9J7BST4_9BACT|nr:cbb3-type cytochrome c oxidase subunit II [Occallatibacter riparius]UWZ85671.1 cbb3-type cytochrome c oxidase subunit II [Occallatibacter riparius]
MRTRAMDGWRGVTLIAITYVYFLIFAQFAFLARLAELGVAGVGVKIVLAAMAVGGVLASLLAPGLVLFAVHATGVRAGFALCGAAALLSLLALNTAAAACIAFLIGVGVGLLTVTLVTHLRDWTGTEHALLKVGLGTGLGYFACNVPWLFAATPERQAIVAAILCAIGLWVAGDPVPAPERAVTLPRTSFARVLAGFAALVWLDSAAFYIIQHAPALKAGTWMGAAHLWTNAVIHLGVALLAALLLTRKGFGFVLAGAFVVLAIACILLMNPAHALQASLFYPAGVSLYSVALVAYPSFLTSAISPVQRGRQAGLIYAVAGWIGSALGIGMGQNLGHVPLAFVAAAGVVVLGPALFYLFRERGKEVIALGGAGLAALVLSAADRRHAAPELSQAERGREVYISEGCIHCHSHYVRPNTADVLMWGPTESLEQIHLEKPPLIGNRRQGPDLAEVGARRSPLWLKVHLITPAEISGRSIMPSYGFLFDDERGDDLVAYLASLHSGDLQQHAAEQDAWSPSDAAMHRASAAEGAQVYHVFCATCHDPNGVTRRKWGASFTTPPLDLRSGPLRYVRDADAGARQAHFARIARFGIRATDMPGHEYLSDQQIASVSLWFMQARTSTAPLISQETKQ